MRTVHSFSSEETKALGAEIAGSLAGRRSRGDRKACVVALRGDLGAGKTTFTQGFFRGLGVKRRPISPTFVIMRHYKIPARRGTSGERRFTDIYHFDAYRLRKEEDVAVLGFQKILTDPRNIILVEWPEMIKGILPSDAVKMDFQYGKNENERIIKIKDPIKVLS